MCQFDAFAVHMTFTNKKIKFSYSSLSFYEDIKEQNIYKRQIKMLGVKIHSWKLTIPFYIPFPMFPFEV